MASKIHEFIGTKVRPIELAALLQTLMRIKRKFYFINDLYWYLDPVSNLGLRLLKYGYYEEDMTELILGNLEEGDTFVDLGTNEGYFSILASKKVGKNGKVFSIEPQSRLWEIILNNANKNHCYNISIIPYAASDNMGEVSITLSPPINTGSSTIVKTRRRSFWKTQTLNSTTLDNLFLRDDIPSIKLMKVDIEGFEFFALKGGAELLKKKLFKNIIIELHPIQLKELGQSVEQINDFMHSFGYKEISGVWKPE